MSPPNDPLLQPFQLKHLSLKNRVMSTSHEPAYSEDGMPKERYRLYHAEKAKGGIGLTMTARYTQYYTPGTLAGIAILAAGWACVAIALAKRRAPR